MAPRFEKSALTHVSPLVSLAIRSMIMVRTSGTMLLVTGPAPWLCQADGRSLLAIGLSRLFGAAVIYVIR